MPFSEQHADVACNFFEGLLKHTADEWYGRPFLLAPWQESVLFYSFSLLAVLAGGLMITQSNPVYAALSFALVVLATCGLFLLNGAPFLSAATIIVYAGAIVVTFLFVIMLAQPDGASDADLRSREPFLACIAGFFLLAALLLVLRQTYSTGDIDALGSVVAVDRPTQKEPREWGRRSSSTGLRRRRG